MRERSRLAAIAIIILTVAVVYIARLNTVAGQYVDDAWYMLLGQALAAGRGYTAVNAAVTPILPNYPPGFPAILSLVFHVMPRFPDNVYLLKLISVAAMAGVGILTYDLGRRRELPHHLALLVALVTVVTPGFLFLATSTVMSECVFTLLQLATVVTVCRALDVRDEKDERSERTRLYWVLGAAGLAALTVLIRTFAIALVLAALMTLLQRTRRWRSGAVFIAGVLVCLSPWVAYSLAHKPTDQARLDQGGTIAYSYVEQIWMRYAGFPESGYITPAELPRRIEENTFGLAARDVGGIVTPVLLRGPAESGREVLGLGSSAGLYTSGLGGARVTVVVSLLLSALALIGFVATARRGVTVVEWLVPISLAIIAAWPWWTFRFALPLAPCLFLYLVAGARALLPTGDPWRAARVLMLCVLGLDLFDHTQYVLRVRSQGASSINWLSEAREVEDTLDWMKTHVTGEGTVATTNPPLVFLRTQRRTLAMENVRVDWQKWKAQGVRYVVCLTRAQLPPPTVVSYTLLYESVLRKFWIIEL